MYQSRFTKRFEKQLKKFPVKQQNKILDRINEILSDPRKAATKLVSTTPPIYKLRVGEYRVFFELDDDLKIMQITDTERRTIQSYRN